MKYLGLDWGLRRIGTAVSEGEIASPLITLEVKNLQEAAEKVSQLVKKEGIDAVVIGKPEGEMGKVVERATLALKRAGLNVIQSDETLSTKEAQKLMLEMGLGQKARREDNALAATIILQRYLDEN